MAEGHPLTLLKLPTEVRAAILKAALDGCIPYLRLREPLFRQDPMQGRREFRSNPPHLQTAHARRLTDSLWPKPLRHNLPPRQRSLVVLIEVASAQGRSENVALIRHLTITGDHELNDVLAGNIPLPQNAKNIELATLFTVHPGLANSQSLCLEFPTFDAWHSLGDRGHQIWLNELPTSAVIYPIFLVWIFRAGVNDIFLSVFRFVTHPTNQ